MLSTKLRGLTIGLAVVVAITAGCGVASSDTSEDERDGTSETTEAPQSVDEPSHESDEQPGEPSTFADLVDDARSFGPAYTEWASRLDEVSDAAFDGALSVVAIEGGLDAGGMQMIVQRQCFDVVDAADVDALAVLDVVDVNVGTVQRNMLADVDPDRGRAVAQILAISVILDPGLCAGAIGRTIPADVLAELRVVLIDVQEPMVADALRNAFAA